jgi:hypothetical protein
MNSRARAWLVRKLHSLIVNNDSSILESIC